MDLYLFIISIVLMGILMQMYFKQWDFNKKSVRTISFKAICTFIPVLLCLDAFISKGMDTSRVLVFAGVLICMLGDVLIEIHFVAGTIAFFCAHLCFIAYFLRLAPFNSSSLIVFVVIYVITVSGFWKYVSKLGKQLPVFLAYPAILIAMFSIAVILPFTLKSVGSLCIAVGAGMFVASDLLLASNTLATSSKIRDRMVLYLYFPAVYLLAVSAFCL